MPSCRRRPAAASLLGAAFALTPWATAFAQVAPTPDSALVMQEHLRRIEQAGPPPAAATPGINPPRPQAPTGTARVVVWEIQFSRSELLDEAQLRALGERYVGRSLGTPDIQQLLDDVAALYRDKGILTAMPVLPRQDLQSGLMRILLVEGQLGRISVKVPRTVDPGWVRRWFDLKPKVVVRTEALRERLVLFNSASDLAAQAQFVPGDQFGVSDLAIEVAPIKRVSGWAFYEASSASSATGRGLAAAGLRVAPTTPQGGRLDGAVLLSPTSGTLTGSFSQPVGTRGWRTGIAGTASHSRSDLPDQGLRVRGASSAFTWDVSRTWALSDPWVLTTGLSLGRYESKNRFYIDPTPDPVEGRDTRTKLALTGNLLHETAAARAALHTSLTTSLNSGSYSYLEVTGSWMQAMDAGGHWLWRAAGVLRSAPSGTLSHMDQFQLGGSDTVRGFNAAAAIGDKGQALQLELRHRPANPAWGQVEAYGFLDAGAVTGSTGRKTLRSMGLGTQVRLPAGMGLDLIASRQLGTPQGGRDRVLLRLVHSW